MNYVFHLSLLPTYSKYSPSTLLKLSPVFKKVCRLNVYNSYLRFFYIRHVSRQTRHYELIELYILGKNLENDNMKNTVSEVQNSVHVQMVKYIQFRSMFQSHSAWYPYINTHLTLNAFFYYSVIKFICILLKTEQIHYETQRKTSTNFVPTLLDSTRSGILSRTCRSCELQVLGSPHPITSDVLLMLQHRD